MPTGICRHNKKIQGSEKKLKVEQKFVLLFVISECGPPIFIAAITFMFIAYDEVWSLIRDKRNRILLNEKPLFRILILFVGRSETKPRRKSEKWCKIFIIRCDLCLRVSCF